MSMSQDERLPLWLPASIYRVIADPECELSHRNMIYSTFDDFAPAQIDEVVDALIEFGIVREDGATDRAHGDLTIVPYEGGSMMPDERLIREEIKYAWVDEDGEQMSPTHDKIKAALNFVSGWESHWKRVKDQPEDWQRSTTRTGKPPHRLRRIAVRYYELELDSTSQALADAYLEDIGS